MTAISSDSVDFAEVCATGADLAAGTASVVGSISGGSMAGGGAVATIIVGWAVTVVSVVTLGGAGGSLEATCGLRIHHAPPIAPTTTTPSITFRPAPLKNDGLPITIASAAVRAASDAL